MRRVRLLAQHMTGRPCAGDESDSDDELDFDDLSNDLQQQNGRFPAARGIYSPWPFNLLLGALDSNFN